MRPVKLNREIQHMQDLFKEVISAQSSTEVSSIFTTNEVTEVQVRLFQISRIVLGLTPYMPASRVLVLFFAFMKDEEGLISAK